MSESCSKTRKIGENMKQELIDDQEISSCTRLFHWSSRPTSTKINQKSNPRHPAVCCEYSRKVIQSYQSREYSCLYDTYLRVPWWEEQIWFPSNQNWKQISQVQSGHDPVSHGPHNKQNYVVRKMEVTGFPGLYLTSSHGMVQLILCRHDLIQSLLWTICNNKSTEIQIEGKWNTENGLSHAPVYVWVVENGWILIFTCIPVNPFSKGGWERKCRGTSRGNTTDLETSIINIYITLEKV